MKIESKFPIIIFAKDFDGKVLYSLGLRKKEQDGSYTKGYMTCKFRKDKKVDDKKKIYIKDAWLDFYLKDKETKPFIFINDFDYVEDTIEKAKDEFAITDEELPF